MLKLILCFVTFFTALQAGAKERVEIVSVEIGVRDYLDQPSLCITTVRQPKSKRMYGIVEDIMDCFWARKANSLHGQDLNMPLKSFSQVMSDEMLLHLQAFDSQLEFLWSTDD